MPIHLVATALPWVSGWFDKFGEIRSILAGRLAFRFQGAGAIKSKRCLPALGDGSYREWKNATRQGLGLFTEFTVYATAVVLIEKHASPVCLFVQHVLTACAYIRDDASSLLPLLFVESFSVRLEQMTHQHPAAIAARMARPTLVRDGRHDDR